ncbi:ABC-three component system protein [Methylobacterium brachiatum]|uniref:ABC-three component system protein n=1 Tax=Methylobacterium brachiatum TaxID=269660 RepID=A0ABV1R674_9HYPH
MGLTAPKRRAFKNTLELTLRRCKGTELQAFFAALMGKVHGHNFESTSTDYSRGDLQCDGHLVEPETVFACYGPVNSGDHAGDASMRHAVAKVRSDFEGARAEWPGMKAWVFVTNYLEPPAQITQEISRLRSEVSDCEIRTFGKEQFERHLLGLDIEDIEDLLANAITDEDFRNVQPVEILEVVDDVMAKVSVRREIDEEPREVPFDKLDFNGLEDAFQDRIRNGFQGAPTVERLLLGHPDPLLAPALASAFKEKYRELELQGLGPGEIMDDLYEFTMAGHRATTRREVAVWTVLAHFFEGCTIFKDRPVAEEAA